MVFNVYQSRKKDRLEGINVPAIGELPGFWKEPQFQFLKGDVTLSFAGKSVKYSSPLITGNCTLKQFKEDVFTVDEVHPNVYVGTTNDCVYSIRLKAYFQEENGLMQINFAQKDAENRCSWILGKDADGANISRLEITSQGDTFVMDTSHREMEPCKVYDLLLWVIGGKISGFINGKIEHSYEHRPVQ